MSDLTLFDDLGRVHTDDPWTSHAAARSVNRGTQRHRVLRALARAGENGLTDSEIGYDLAIRETAAGTRRKELEEMGYCVRTTATRPTRYGNPGLVHVITPEGVLALRSIG